MSKLKQPTEVKKFGSVWDALADTPADAENMKIRAELMNQLREFIKRNNLTQVEAAKRCQVTQPRMNDLMHGRFSKFSLDALVNMTAAAGLHVKVMVEEEAFA